MGGKSTGSLFNNWFKNFTITVFTQTFHAFFLVFVCRIVNQLINYNNSSQYNVDYGIISILIIAAMMAIIKFEKLIKSLFGLEDGLVGDLKTSGAKMFAGMKGAASLAGSVAEPFKKHSEAKRKVDRLGNKLASEGGHLTAKDTNKVSRAIKSRMGINPDEQTAFGAHNIGNDYIDERERTNNGPEGNFGNAGNSGNSGNSGTSGSGDSSEATGTNTETNSLLRELINTTKESTGAGDSTAEKYNDALREMKSAARDRWANTASVMASTTVASGVFDESSEILAAGAVINKPFAAGSTAIINSQEGKKAREATGSDRFEGKGITEAIKTGFKTAAGTTNSNNMHPVKQAINVAVNTVGVGAKIPVQAITGNNLNFKPKQVDVDDIN